MANIGTSIKNWSSTPSSNQPDGTDSATIAGDFRDIEAAVRLAIASQDTIASAATTDLGSKDAGTLSVTGTTTITALGTVSAGIRKRVIFAGALTLTHNGTSLILPSAANITTAANDTAEFESLGSGNWRCLWYSKANGASISGAADGSITYPKLASTVITGATAETAPAVDDLLLMHDTSASTVDKITLANIWTVINAFTEDTTPDKAADFLATYDASASGVKKASPENLVKSALNATGTAPMYACRAFINFNGTGTPAIRASGNVTSLTDNGVGDYTINFATALPDANYAINVTTGDIAVGFIGSARFNTTAPTTSAARIGTFTTAGGAADLSYVFASVFR